MLYYIIVYLIPDSGLTQEVISMYDTGFSFTIFMWVLITIGAIILGVLIVLAPIKLWTIDRTLKEILEELRKKK